MIGSKEYEDIVLNGDIKALWSEYKNLELHTCDIMNKYHGRALRAENAFGFIVLVDVAVFVAWLIFRF